MTTAIGLDSAVKLLIPAFTGTGNENNISFDNIMNIFSSEKESKNNTDGIKTGLLYNGLTAADIPNMEMSPEEIVDRIIEKTKEKYEAPAEDTGLTSENKDRLIQISQLLDLVISLMMSKTMDGKYEAGDYPKLSEMIKEFTSAINNIAAINTENLDDLLDKLTDLVLEMTGDENTENKFEVSERFEKMCRERIEQYQKASAAVDFSQDTIINIKLENLSDI